MVLSLEKVPRSRFRIRFWLLSSARDWSPCLVTRVNSTLFSSRADKLNSKSNFETVSRAFVLGLLVWLQGVCVAQDALDRAQMILEQAYANLQTEKSTPEETSKALILALSEGELRAENVLFQPMTRAPEYRFRLAEEAIRTLRRKLIGYAPTELGEVRKFIELYYPPGNAASDAAEVLYRLAAKAELLRKEADFEGLKQLLESSEGIAEVRIVEARIIRAAREEASLKLSEEPGKALQYLSYVRPGLRSEEIFKLTNGAINQFANLSDPGEIEKNWVFYDKDVFSLVLQACASHEGSSRVLSEMLEDRIIRMLKSNNVSEAEASYILLLKVRPDPHRDNDTIRLGMLTSAKSREARDFALGRLDELQIQNRELDLSTKLILLWEGYYKPSFPRNFLITVIASGLGVILVFIWSRFVAPSVQKAKKKKKRAQKKQARGRSDEYSDLLAVFGLDDTATGEDIKKAYRAKMKQLHPDASKEVDPDKVQEFMQLQKIHKRIMEIRQLRF